MKSVSGWVLAAGLVITSAGTQVQAQALDRAGNPPVVLASDVGAPYGDGPYAAMPPAPGYGPTLLPPTEVYTVLRENGFSPLGIPRQRGFVYTIAVLARGGEDGRLVIDARNGRVIRFVPGYRIGGRFNDDVNVAYGPVAAPPPPAPISGVYGTPRPPAAVPRVASRAVPVPKAPPQLARPATVPLPAQQSAAVQPKAAEPQTAVPAPGSIATSPAAAAPAIVEAKPAPSIAPTQELPKAQGLE